jgi:hypothetical protein
MFVDAIARLGGKLNVRLKLLPAVMYPRSSISAHRRNVSAKGAE